MHGLAEILTNKEVIAIDQDPSGTAGDRVYNGTQVIHWLMVAKYAHVIG